MLRSNQITMWIFMHQTCIGCAISLEKTFSDYYSLNIFLWQKVFHIHIPCSQDRYAGTCYFISLFTTWFIQNLNNTRKIKGENHVGITSRFYHLFCSYTEFNFLVITYYVVLYVLWWQGYSHNIVGVSNYIYFQGH